MKLEVLRVVPKPAQLIHSAWLQINLPHSLLLEKIWLILGQIHSNSTPIQLHLSLIFQEEVLFLHPILSLTTVQLQTLSNPVNSWMGWLNRSHGIRPSCMLSLWGKLKQNVNRKENDLCYLTPYEELYSLTNSTNIKMCLAALSRSKVYSELTRPEEESICLKDLNSKKKHYVSRDWAHWSLKLGINIPLRHQCATLFSTQLLCLRATHLTLCSKVRPVPTPQKPDLSNDLTLTLLLIQLPLMPSAVAPLWEIDLLS